MQKGKIILLNGVSSSGKTTLAKALKESLNEPYFLLGCDMFQGDAIPTKINGEYHHETHLKMFLKAMTVFHHSIKMFSDMGCNAIVDHVFLERHKTFDECIELLNQYPVLFVHVTCPLEEIRRRETERGDRFIGQGEEQLAELFLRDKDMYDVTVDTYNNSQNECVNKIKEALDCPDKFTAFRTLWRQRGN